MSISPWSNLTESEDNVAYYLAVYGILAGANSFFTLVRAFLFAYGGICAAVRIHKLLLARILKVHKIVYICILYADFVGGLANLFIYLYLTCVSLYQSFFNLYHIYP